MWCSAETIRRMILLCRAFRRAPERTQTFGPPESGTANVELFIPESREWTRVGIESGVAPPQSKADEPFAARFTVGGRARCGLERIGTNGQTSNGPI